MDTEAVFVVAVTRDIPLWYFVRIVAAFSPSYFFPFIALPCIFFQLGTTSPGVCWQNEHKTLWLCLHFAGFYSDAFPDIMVGE